ncbi:hypothetical protein XpiCFBP4643_10795 [Xanthomonas pisi]|uniref:Uncharacterized protein n=1 Tax=Xanthomonas pisi TaxID=56457 RepID=A0A2S7D3X2_9XANT|nr:hypothetical protein XpiCFBP4643_10795 [Xanthomonas pisi]
MRATGDAVDTFLLRARGGAFGSAGSCRLLRRTLMRPSGTFSRTREKDVSCGRRDILTLEKGHFTLEQ